MPTLPPSFYRAEDTKRAGGMRDLGVDEQVARIRNADIVLVNVTSADDPMFQNAAREFGFRKGAQSGDELKGVPQAAYIPMNDTGGSHPVFAHRVVGLSIEDLRDMATDTSKHVIAVIGGDSSGAAPRVTQFPFFNHLVTDFRSAQNAMFAEARRGETQRPDSTPQRAPAG